MLGTHILLNIREALLHPNPQISIDIPGSTPEMIRFQAAAERALHSGLHDDDDIEYGAQPVISAMEEGPHADELTQVSMHAASTIFGGLKELGQMDASEPEIQEVPRDALV
jgi:hypothetical protein